jgi:uncharacterized damage-inducible protein DinB
MSNTGCAIESAISRMVHYALSAPRHFSTEADRFQTVREKTLGILNEVTPEQALWTARPETWSIAQVADHLLRSEELYREQIERLFKMAREGKTGTIDIPYSEVDTTATFIPREAFSVFEAPLRMFNVFVPFALREAMVRYPVVSALVPKVSAPRTGLSLEKLRQESAASLAKSMQLYHGPLPSNLERVSMNHPAMGNNNPVEMLGILIAHEERHQGQIESIRSNPKFPKALATPSFA